MSLTLPKGIQFGFASLLDSPSAVTGFTSADPAIATGSTVAAGSVVVVGSNGWPILNNRVSVVGDAEELLGIDTTEAALFPGTSGAGTLRVAGDFTNFTQQGDPTTSGGEQQFWNGILLEDPLGRQISLPTFKNAKTLTIPLYYDADEPWYKAAQVVDARGEPVVLRARMLNGDALYWYGYLSFDADPSMASNTPMGNTAVFTIIGASTLVKA